MFLNQKILFLFNKFFISFVKDVKETSETLKVSIKKNYKIVDKASTENIDEFWGAWENSLNALYKNDQSVMNVTLLKEFKLKEVLDAFPDNEKETFWNHIYVLLLFSYLYNEITEPTEPEIEDEEVDEEVDEADEADEDPLTNLLNNVSDTNKKTEQIESLFNKVVEIIAKIQKGETVSEIDEILDDDVRTLLSKITPKCSKNAPKPEANPNDANSSKPEFDMGSMFGGMAQNSKIANLAKEISEEIDVSNIKIEKPEDIMKMMDFSGSNNVMGDIIKKVSTKISDKIQTGELKQDDLLGEAMTMMNLMGKGGLGNMFGNNPMMSELMKSMKKGKPMQTKQEVFNKASTRDRLREKLEKRKQSQNNE
jgi:hypothetical protein